ncbi:MAG TPA: hypothetical protein VGL61_36800 [Kofleriaceae bacterium]
MDSSRTSVPEVWLFEAGAFRVFALRDDRYERIAASEVLPELDLSHLASFVGRRDQHVALKEFRDQLRR